jgi:hypothetical protein
MKTQNEAYNAARNGGWMNADEIRYKQSMNPIEDEKVGKIYWMPSNMTEAGKEPPEPKDPVAPVLPPEEPDEDDPAEEEAKARQDEILDKLASLEIRMAKPQEAPKLDVHLAINNDGKTVKKTQTYLRGPDGEIISSETIEEPLNGK